MGILKKYQNTWISEYLIEEAIGFFKPAVWEKSKSLIEDNCVSEVYVEPGRLSSRITLEKKASIRVVLTLKELESEIFDKIVQFVVTDESILLHLYNNQLTDAFFQSSLVKDNLLFKIEDLKAIVEDEEVGLQDEKVAAVFEKFIEHALSNPLLCLTFRGYGAEQFLHDVRESRTHSVLKIREQISSTQGISEFHNFEISAEDFYQGKQLSNLDLLVRADELPAALLKRLDHLPSQGGVEFIDKNLEMAYERITRLAQSLARFI